MVSKHWLHCMVMLGKHSQYCDRCLANIDYNNERDWCLANIEQQGLLSPSSFRIRIFMTKQKTSSTSNHANCQEWSRGCMLLWVLWISGNIWMSLPPKSKKNVTSGWEVASYPGLLTPAFVACSTNLGEGAVKLSHVQWCTWGCEGVALSFCTDVKQLLNSKKVAKTVWCQVLSRFTVHACDR